MSADLIDLVQRLGQPHVLVLGDVMLDRYVWGDAERISQEAPVILLHADRQEERLGGASSVATMLRALGAHVHLAGVVGADANGRCIRHLLDDLQIDHECLLIDPDRPSTVKERYIGRAQQRHPQQMIRVDYEVRAAISIGIEEKLKPVLDIQLRKADVVLVSDYDKGVCTPGLLGHVIAQARRLGRPVLADPIRCPSPAPDPGGEGAGSRHPYDKYRGCSILTPNRLEAGLATGRTLRDHEEALQAAQQLLRRFDLEASIVTLDKDGMALAHGDGRRQVFSTRPRQVYDITGAGDMVLSMLGMALAAGADYDQAIRLANVAGGLEVEKIGVATVTRDEILRDLGRTAATGVGKILSRPELHQELEARRRLGQRIAFTNGCFDLLHAGHVQYLQEARAQAEVLVVGLNSDRGVRALKGPQRPLQPELARAEVLAALQAVDYVTLFDEPTPLELIQLVRPEVLVKGSDYRKSEVVGADLVESYGGRVHLAALKPGFSTSSIVQKMVA